MNHVIIGMSAIVMLWMSGFAQAAVPHVFSDGEPAIAAEVNENFNALDTRVASLEEGKAGDDNTISIDVDCDKNESVNHVIAGAAPANHLFVNISGTCRERIVITRSNVSLLGDVDSVTAIEFIETPLSAFHSSLTVDDLGESQGAINILGAQNIIIAHLTISGAVNDNIVTDEPGSGVAVRANGSAFIQHSIITGNRVGIDTRAGGSVILSNNQINDNLVYGVMATDGGMIRLIGGNTIIQAGPRSGTSLNSAVAGYRNSTVTVLGRNTITASPSSDNRAIEMHYGSQFRSYHGLLMVNGTASVTYNSRLDYRDTEHSGNIFIGIKGTVRLQNRLNQTTTGVIVNGDVSVSTLGVLTTSSGTTMNSSVTCNGNSSYAFVSGEISGLITGC